MRSRAQAIPPLSVVQSGLGFDGLLPVAPSGKQLQNILSPFEAFGTAAGADVDLSVYTALSYPPATERTGLRNMGNTCYLNAILQALVAVPALSRFFCETPALGSAIDADSDVKIDHAFRHLVLRLLGTRRNSNTHAFAPKALRGAIIKSNELLAELGQHDAHEALLALLTGIDEPLTAQFPLGLYANDFGATRPRLRAGASGSLFGGGGGSSGASGSSSTNVGGGGATADSAHYTASAAATTGSSGGGGGGAAARPTAALNIEEDEDVRLPPGREWLVRGPYSGTDSVQRSIVSDVFQFVVRGHVRCCRCKTDSFTYAGASDLHLPLPRRQHPVAAGSNGALHSPAAAVWAGAGPVHVENSGGGGGGGGSSEAEGAHHASSSSSSSSRAGGGGSLLGWFSRIFNGSGGDGDSNSLGLGDLLYSYFDWEHITGDYWCDVCKSKGDADKRSSFATLPEVLIVCLKRFEYRQASGGLLGGLGLSTPGGHKVSTPVSFPVTEALDLRPFISLGAHAHATRSFVRRKALQAGDEGPPPESPRSDSISSTFMSSGGSGRIVADVSVEAQGILLHASSLATGVTGVEAASAAAREAAIATAGGHLTSGAAGVGMGAGVSGMGVTSENMHARASLHAPQLSGTKMNVRGSGASAATPGNIFTDSIPVPLSRCVELDAPPTDTRYDLTSVVQHIGAYGAGHYIAHARDGTSWHTYDDEIVTPLSSEAVANREGYILIFSRKAPPAGSPLSRVVLPSRSPETTRNTEAMDVDGATTSTSYRSATTTAPAAAAYISRWWWHRYRSFTHPGPMTNADILCDHGALKHDLEPERGRIAVELTAQEYAALARTYGAAEPALRSLEKCDVCRAERQLLERRRMRERTRIQSIDSQRIKTEGLEEGDPRAKWYIISSVWLKRWRDFINGEGTTDGTGRGILPPGPIDNARLLGKGGAPLSHLRPADHFRGVNYDVWTFLHDIYGGGPVLARDRIELKS